MQRRAFLLAGLASAASPGPAEEMRTLVSRLAAALSEGNASAFLKVFDRSMKDYSRLERQVTALVAQNDVTSSIEFLTDEGDDRVRRVELDWFLEIRTRQDTGVFARRRQVVKCRVERRQKGRWTIVSLEPVEFFNAPGLPPD